MTTSGFTLARRVIVLAASLSALGALVLFVAASRTGDGDGRLLVADLRGRALVIVDLARPEELRRIALPGGPHELLELPDGRIVASLEQSGALAVVDLASGEVERIATGGLPHGLALDGTTLYVTDRAVGGVRRFDTGDWSEREPVEAGAWPHAVAVLPGGALAVANASASTLLIGGHERAVSELPETIALAPDGTAVATAGALGGAVEVYALDGSPLRRIAVGGRPVRVAFSPDGRLIAAALSAGASVALIDEDGAVDHIAVSGVPDGLAFSPDGRWLFVGDVYAGVVTVVDVERRAVAYGLDLGRSAGAMLLVAR